MSFQVVNVIAEGSEKVVNELPIPPLAYGITAFVCLFAGLLVTYAFRSVGTRHEDNGHD